MPEIVKAFIARSFEEQDARRLSPLLEYLKTFENYGFFCKSAEPAEAEEVSDKIQRIIRECGVFIGMFSRKYPIIAHDGPESGANPEPRGWTAPSWVLQESGYALGLGAKKLLFFVEPGVELSKLAGDLEYIEYDSAKPDLAFKRTNEALGKIIRESLAFEVAPTIRQETQAPPIEPKTGDDKTPDVPDLLVYMGQVSGALNRGDASAARQGYEGGLAHIKRGEPEMETLWKAFYHQQRALSGYPEGQGELRSLEATYPDSHYPPASLARCLRKFGDPLAAAEAYKSAAMKAPADEKAFYMIRSAECEEEANNVPAAHKILLGALDLATTTQHFEVLSKLYENSKLSNSKYDAFAIGEWSLRKNGAQMDLRFKLAYDYAESDLNDLAAYHYGALLDQREGQSVTMNNLALVLGSLELPIMAVDLFRRAFEAGNTLAAGNLAYRYINNGMVEEARTIIDKALDADSPDAMVTDALAAIGRGRSEEEKRHAEVLSEAKEKREFFVAMGEAIFSKQTATVEGKWHFPTVEIDLKVEGDLLKGQGTNLINPEGLEALLGGYDKNEPHKLEIFRFEGRLTGRVCIFKLSSERKYISGYVSPYDRSSEKEGFAVFAADGKTARVLEAKPKIELHEIARVEPAC